MPWGFGQKVNWKMSQNKLLLIMNKVILNGKMTIIGWQEMQTIIFSRKFLLFLFAFVLPPVTQLIADPAPISVGSTDVEEYFQSFIGKFVLTFFSFGGDEELVPFGGIAGLIVLILIILICSEFLAQEFEEKTISMLLVKPIRRSGIIFGKLFGFLILIGILSVLVIFGHATFLVWQMQGNFDQLLNICLNTAPICTLTLILGFFSLASLMMVLSAFFNRGLYAALSGILILFGNEIFIQGIIGPEYRLSYQLGIILEKYVTISEYTLYSGDFLLSLVVIVGLNAFCLITTMVIFFRRDFP